MDIFATERRLLNHGFISLFYKGFYVQVNAIGLLTCHIKRNWN